MGSKAKSRTPLYVGAAAIAAAIGIAIAAFAMTSNNQTSSVSANQSEIAGNSSGVFAPDSLPYGKSYPAWSVLWWKYIQGLPQSDNPIFDQNGEKCQVGQDNPNVWFAAGTTGGKAERTCTISSTKSPLIAIINAECSHAEDKSLDTDAKRQACAEAGVRNAIMSLSIDGHDVPNLKQFWFEAPIYNLTLPKGNIWGVPAQVTDERSAGYWVMLKPLSPGEHLVHFSGAVTSIEGTQTFALDVIYHLKVE